MSQTVFLLWHVHSLDGEDNEKLVGVFSEHGLALAAQNESVSLPGFRDHPDGFDISEYTLDRKHWTSGFVTVD